MKVKNKIIGMIFFIILIILCYNNKSNAASAKLTASSTNVVVGTPVTINVNIRGAAWSVNVSGAVTSSYVDNTEDAEDTNITKTLSFTPDKAGNFVVKLNGNVTGSADLSATIVSDSITINVKEKNKETNTNTTTTTTTTTPTSTTTTTTAPTPATTTTTNNKQSETKKSSNANISSLWITPREYDFTGSKASVQTYNTKVPYEVEEITVGGSTQDSKAKFTAGIGKQKLKVGNNSVKVEVTAEDGSKKTYTINVTREEKKEEEIKNTENQEENKIENTNTISEETNQTELISTVEDNKENKFKDSDLIKLEIKGYEISPKYSPDIYEYKINVNNTIDKLEVITEKKDDSINVEIVGNTNLKEGENIITVLVHNEKTNQNYTYQILVDKLPEFELNSINQTLNNQTNNAEKNKNLIIGVVVGIIILIIIFIIIKGFSNSNDVDEYDEEDDDDNENDEKINLEDDEKLFKRIDKQDIIAEEKVSSSKQRKKGKHF